MARSPSISPKALAIRMAIPPDHLAAAIRDLVRRADPKVPITEMQLAHRDDRSRDGVALGAGARACRRLRSWRSCWPTIGIHGLLSFAVSQRVQEIGVRLALGAQSSDILSLIVWRGVLLAIAGIVPGVLIAYTAGRSMEALLAGIRPTDALTLASATALTFADDRAWHARPRRCAPCGSIPSRHCGPSDDGGTHACV